MPEIPELGRYARRATEAIPDRRERRDARAELYEHAVTLYEEESAAGAAHDDAVATALEQLGEPAGYTRDLARAHRTRLTPKTVIVLVLVVAASVVLLIGLFNLVSILSF